MRFLVIPGFGDSAQYWVSLIGSGADSVTLLEWPGLWDGEPSGDPMGFMLDQVESWSLDEPGVLVAHSLGTRVALEAAQRFRIQALVLLAPALGDLSFMGAQEVERWEKEGWRISKRPDPATGENVELKIPYSYAKSISAFPPAKTPQVKTLALLMSEDVERNAYTRELLKEHELVDVEGGHRWWENEKSAIEAKSRILSWLA